MNKNYAFRSGTTFPIGATYVGDGVNFSLYSKSAIGVTLLIWEDADAIQPSQEFVLDIHKNRTGHYWHIHVENLKPGALYAYRVDGPYAPQLGFRFNPNKVLVDPYAKSIYMGENYDRNAARGWGDNLAHCLKGVVVDARGFDWEDTKPLNRPFSETIVYEMHVKGFTAHPSSGVSKEKRGTYAGVIEKIPYLKSLGVTAVELLPIQQFDPFDAPDGRINYWGYSPIGFFAPHSAYSSDKTPLGAFNEFRQMVKALHKAGIEVFLDVVFNHTAEGDESGPVLSYKGIENGVYYMLNQENSAIYQNYTGCGNTVNANHSISRRLIRDCLKFWVQQMHVDGFRFDLASVLSRDEQGEPMASPPVLLSIDTDPVLAGTKVIAEAWDAAGLYQVGNFVGDRWQEWNGKYRDDVRSFIKGDEGYAGVMADRLLGSPDIYYSKNQTPHRSINFITAHDGFTLWDLVSYNEKHNEANNEGNRDGENHNRSWNCGWEGESTDPAVIQLRKQQIRNFFAILMSSLGTPMISMGDEIGRTQWGNNNAYCQDNELSWMDWTLLDKNRDLFTFVQELIRWRKSNHTMSHSQHASLAEVLSSSHISWHGVKPQEPDWGENSRTVAFTLRDPRSKETLYFAMNAWHESICFSLPDLPKGEIWQRLIDTSKAGAESIMSAGATPCMVRGRYEVAARSFVVLISRAERRPS